MTAPSPIAQTPDPPYFAVIFTSLHSPPDPDYAATATRMIELASGQPGFLGVESSTRDESGLGITVSYWKDEASIRNWKANTEHLAAQSRGQSDWYSAYQVRIARVDRDYSQNR